MNLIHVFNLKKKICFKFKGFSVTWNIIKKRSFFYNYKSKNRFWYFPYVTAWRQGSLYFYFTFGGLFKANLLKEKDRVPNLCYNTIISHVTFDDFPYLTTFEFVNDNKEDWGLSNSRTIRSYNEFLWTRNDYVNFFL